MTDDDKPDDIREVTISPVEPDPEWESYIGKLRTKEFTMPNVQFINHEEGVSCTYMPVPRCDTCRWWYRDRLAKEEAYIRDFLDTFGKLPGYPGQLEEIAGKGTCLMAQKDGRGARVEGSGGNEHLITDPAFGCTEWEKKEGS